MLIKLGIIAGVVILGTMIVLNETSLFPQASTQLHNTLDDTKNATLTATDALEYAINDTVSNVMNASTKVGHQITDEIGHVTEQSKSTIESSIEDFNPLESVQDVFDP